MASPPSNNKRKGEHLPTSQPESKLPHLSTEGHQDNVTAYEDNVTAAFVMDPVIIAHLDGEDNPLIALMEGQCETGSSMETQGAAPRHQPEHDLSQPSLDYDVIFVGSPKPSTSSDTKQVRIIQNSYQYATSNVLIKSNY